MCSNCNSVVGSDGAMINLSSVSAVISRNGDGTAAYYEVVDPNTGNTYRKTLTYSGGYLTVETGWVKQ